MKNKNSIKYYTDLKNQGDKSKKVGWKNNYAQQIRFEQLINLLGVKSDFSINDLGCGLGDFYNFLIAKDFTEFKYFGYDIFEDMISSAKTLNSKSNASFSTIIKSKEINNSDYTVASGIFNLKHSKSEAEWLGYILNELEIMNEKSDKGFAFNMLTKYSDKEFMKKELYYADPCFIFDYCKRNFSKNVALLHDYQEYDFTIIIKK